MNPLLIGAVADLEETINQLSLRTVLVAAVVLLILVAVSMVAVKRKKNKLKLPLFILIVLVVAGSTFTISGATVFLNLKSATGGPVHWHADIEFWACGNELELRDPTGFLSNKIGTATLHEHNDKRIHLEGVPIELPRDASLGKFMDVIGGTITDRALTVPLNKDKLFETGKNEEDGDGAGAPAPDIIEPYLSVDETGAKLAQFKTGQTCGDVPASVQVFAYSYNAKDKTYTQTKIDNPADYQIAKESQVPPGDCVIVEFGPALGRTDKLCRQYGIRDTTKCERFGVAANERKVCENHEIRGEGSVEGASSEIIPEVYPTTPQTVIEMVDPQETN